LVILLLLCWPAAIIYYFTREKVPVQEFSTYATPQPQYGPAAAPLPQYAPPQAVAAPAVAPGVVPICPKCGRSTTYMPQYNRYFCHSCQQYA
jgi:hypothetical protein